MIGETQATLAQEMKSAGYVCDPSHGFRLTASSPKFFCAIEVANIEFDVGLPTVKVGTWVMQPYAPIMTQLNCGPDAFAQHALQYQTAGIVNVSTHEIKPARSTRNDDLSFEVEE
jgi:hypothetical protein